MQRILSWGLVLILSTTFLSSCLKSSNSQPEKLTYLYLMHMAPTAPAVDLYFGSQKASSNSIAFNTISGSYAGIRPATFDVTYKKGGGDSLVADIPAAVYDTLKPYTLLLYSDVDGKGRAARISDDVSNLNPDKMYFRFWHLSYDVEDVDFFIGTTKVDAGRYLADNVGGSTYNSFNQFEPGTYTLTVKESGTDNVIATSDEANLVKGGVYTIFLKGKKAGTGTDKAAVGVVRNF
jgi:hypothetical protein